MNRPDDLQHLWQTQAVDTVMKGEQMRIAVLKEINTFDREIRMRNGIEIVAALVVAAFFGFAAWMQQNGIQRLGSAIVAAAALWIVFYIRRNGADDGDPAPDQPSDSFRRALARKYERQIQLLRNVKFWYLLPMYVGLLVGNAGSLQEHARTRPLTWVDAIPPLIYTSVFLGIWWLNEVYAVRKLERLRTGITSGVDDETPC